jgi:folylpolyglutamate synthase/dihydropteroate synthase
MFAALLPAVSHLILTRASTERSADPSDPGSPGAREPRSAGDHRESAARALEIAWRISPRIVVAGSIFLLGDVMKELEGS